MVIKMRSTPNGKCEKNGKWFETQSLTTTMSQGGQLPDKAQ